jgi:hypothetical protein
MGEFSEAKRAQKDLRRPKHVLGTASTRAPTLVGSSRFSTHSPERLAQYVEVIRAHGHDDSPCARSGMRCSPGWYFGMRAVAAARAGAQSETDACGFDPLLPIPRKPKPRAAVKTGISRIAMLPTREPVAATHETASLLLALANVVALKESLHFARHRSRCALIAGSRGEDQGPVLDGSASALSSVFGITTGTSTPGKNHSTCAPSARKAGRAASGSAASGSGQGTRSNQAVSRS